MNHPILLPPPGGGLVVTFLAVISLMIATALHLYMAWLWAWHLPRAVDQLIRSSSQLPDMTTRLYHLWSPPSLYPQGSATSSAFEESRALLSVSNRDDWSSLAPDEPPRSTEWPSPPSSSPPLPTVTAPRTVVRALGSERAALRRAVQAWLKDPVKAERWYGSMADWDVSAQTDFSHLFQHATHFSQDLSRWNVSSARYMRAMFQGATHFHSDLDAWVVGRVLDFSYMFHEARAFDGNVSTWDIRGARDLSYMFCNATSFQGDLSVWTTSRPPSTGAQLPRDGTNHTGVTKHRLISSSHGAGKGLRPAQNVEAMFQGAISFQSDLSQWETGTMTNMRSMFRGAALFNSPMDRWNVASVQDFSHMFQEATRFDQALCWEIRPSATTDEMFAHSRGRWAGPDWCGVEMATVEEMVLTSGAGALMVQHPYAWTGLLLMLVAARLWP